MFAYIYFYLATFFPPVNDLQLKKCSSAEQNCSKCGRPQKTNGFGIGAGLELRLDAGHFNANEPKGGAELCALFYSAWDLFKNTKSLRVAPVENT